MGLDEESARKTALKSSQVLLITISRCAQLCSVLNKVLFVVELGTHRLLGVIVGAQATGSFIMPLQSFTTDELITFVFNLPTLSVLYKQAAYNALTTYTVVNQKNIESV